MSKKKPAEWLEQILAAKSEVTGAVQETISALYEALVRLPEFRLEDGRKAKVEVLYPPEVNEEGEIQCGIDVRLSNGSLLEFTLKNTGWEQMFAQENGPQQHPRER